MQVRPQRLLMVWAVVCLAAAAAAQTPWSVRTTGFAPAPLVVQGLGRATVPVDGLWAFHPGDDLAWAQPGYDDSEWARIETGKTWEEQGFRNLTGFGWYRREIVLDGSTNSDWRLGLMLPAVQDAAEVYWNGRLVGSFGKVYPHAVWYGFETPAFPFVFDLAAAGEQHRSGVLAIRVWKAPYAYLSLRKMGGLVQTPVLGDSEALEGVRTAAVYNWLRSNEYSFGLALLAAAVSVLAFLGWLRDRKQWMLFWLGAYLLRRLGLVLTGGLPWGPWRLSYGTIGTWFSLTDAALWFLLLYLLELRSHRRLVWWTRVFACITVGLQILEGSEQFFDWTKAPHFFLGADVALTIPCLLVQAWGIVLVAYAFSKRLDAARWTVAATALLVDSISNAGSWFGLGARWTHWTIANKIQQVLFTIWGNPFDIETIATTLLIVSIVYAVWKYETEQRQRQAHLDEEFHNAQELQQVLVPELLPEVAGYTVTSAYQPAQEVGGDFFQVIPLEDGAALAVVGDVSGKGLKAAMTVSLIVGALRSLAETTSAPAEILAGLNRRLHGRLRGGFATCVVVRLDAEGGCAIANAGHLPPFLNGEEVSVPGSLPLGLSIEAEYEETAVHLAAGDRLTLYTDGLPEARDAAGALFGFARVTELVTAHAGASELAAAAVEFGQEDDVTVLSLCYAGGDAARMAVGLAAEGSAR